MSDFDVDQAIADGEGFRGESCSAMETWSVALVETDGYDTTMMTWVYPSLSPTLKTCVLDLVNTVGGEESFFFKVGLEFVYVRAVNLPRSKDATPGTKRDAMGLVRRIHIALACKTFNPEKYQALLSEMTMAYERAWDASGCRVGDPTKVLEVILIASLTGRVGSDFNVTDYGEEKAQAVGCLPTLVRGFGEQMALVWLAVLLKKRVLVLGNTASKESGLAMLQSVVRSLPQLARHRQDFSVIRPLITSSATHVEDLASAGVYVAGTLDPQLAQREDLYDVLITLADLDVRCAPHASTALKMGPTHRDVAATMMTALEADTQGDGDNDGKMCSNQTMVDALSRHTLEIIEQVRNNRERIELKSWLHQLGTAEGIQLSSTATPSPPQVSAE
jgi:hypothetical protein